MIGFENCKWCAHVRVRFPITSTDIAIEACELLGAEICLRHQDTQSRQLAFRKPGRGACRAQEWSHTALPGPRALRGPWLGPQEKEEGGGPMTLAPMMGHHGAGSRRALTS